MQHGTEYIHEMMPVQHNRDQQSSHDYLVMHHPKPGMAPATSIEQKDPHWVNYRYDSELPIFRAPNVDPTPTPTVHATPKVAHKDIPITHPRKSSVAEGAKDGSGYLVAYPPLPGQKVPVYAHEKAHPLNDEEHMLHHADFHGEEPYYESFREYQHAAGQHHS